MSTAIKTFTKKRRAHPFIETEAGASSEDSSEESSEGSSEGSSSEDSDELDENEYDMNDGFMVEDDSSDEMEPHALKSDDVFYERRRAKMALDEVSVLKKRVETFQRRLKEVSISRKRWRQRAHHLAERVNNCEQQLSQTTRTTDKGDRQLTSE